jgi:hypothetical protein
MSNQEESLALYNEGNHDIDTYQSEDNNKSVALIEKQEIVMFSGMSQNNFTEHQKQVLLAPINSDDIRIRPDGFPYYPQTFYRRILNDLFGPGNWCIKPETLGSENPVCVMGSTVCFSGSLYINGKFISFSIGEGKYIENNSNSSFATAFESAKSDCITRCCKDLGIAGELWNPNFTEQWIKENAVQVWCVNKKDNTKKQFWRKNTSAPIDTYPWKEQGSDNRNQEQQNYQEPVQKTYQKQETARTVQAPAQKADPRDGQILEIRNLCDELKLSFDKLEL